MVGSKAFLQHLHGVVIAVEEMLDGVWYLIATQTEVLLAAPTPTDGDGPIEVYDRTPLSSNSEESRREAAKKLGFFDS